MTTICQAESTNTLPLQELQARNSHVSSDRVDSMREWEALLGHTDGEALTADFGGANGPAASDSTCAQVLLLQAWQMQRCIDDMECSGQADVESRLEQLM